MISKEALGNRDPSDQLAKATDALQVVCCALSGDAPIGEGSRIAIRNMIYAVIEDLAPVADLLDENNYQWDGTPSFTTEQFLEMSRKVHASLQ